MAARKAIAKLFRQQAGFAIQTDNRLNHTLRRAGGAGGEKLDGARIVYGWQRGKAVVCARGRGHQPLSP